MKRLYCFITVCVSSLLLLDLQSQAQDSTSLQGSSPSKVQQYVSSVADGEPLGSSVWGMLAVTASGDTLASYCSGRKMLPASNMKLITTGSALYSLGPDYRFETRLGYSGVIRGGVLHGDLYIIGRGDPTLGSQDQFSQNIDSVFAQWVSILREAGIHKIHGHIVGDGRYYDGSPENGSWAYDDIGTYYGAGGNGLAFFRDRQDFRVSAGDAVGASVNVSVDYPLTPWVSYVYPCVTAPSGTGDNLYLFTTDLSPAAQIRGTFAIDHAPRVEECSNKYPALTCAYHFCSFLENNAVKVTKGPADIDVLGNIRSLRNFHPLKGRKAVAAPVQDSLTVIGRTFSPTLSQIVYVTNHESDNFYAETLLKEITRKHHDTVVYDTCVVAEKGILAELGVDTGYGIRIEDGSGLSRRNYVSPDFFCRYLGALSKTTCFDTFLSSLPHPGGSGTVGGRLSDQAQTVRSRVRMKSGSMNGVRAYSGYILPSAPDKQMIRFSIITNNCTAPSGDVQLIIDRIITLLAAEN